MAKYSIVFRKSVTKDLKAIPKKDQVRILQRIAQLAEDPRPPACKRLSGQQRYRIRQGIQSFDLLEIAIKGGHSHSRKLCCCR